MVASRVISLPPEGIAKDSSDDTRLMSDENLVAVAKEGRRIAFDELHNRHAGKMFRVAHRITRNREDAEDAVQECFLSAFIQLRAFDGRSKFLTWLTRIATNAALMKLRKNRTSREVPVKGPAETPGFLIEDVLLADSLPNPEERLAKSEQEAILRDAIAKLRPSLRKAIEVYQLQESSLHETAEILGISITATKARMFQARAALRRAKELQLIGPSITKIFILKSPTGTTSDSGVFSLEAQ
jgi:RNA polymerase sigma factor (sigma-70 family)